ncbi:MAG: isopentenyl-diphosphate Delta-isomerase [Firmicutes bacterium]|nr:isopentenyl-diphosphate Delta-isomerase [Bacillota bacterium]
MDEIILVDALDRPAGSAEKMAAHRRPMLHRAFSIFLYDGDRILLQKRAAGKYHSGGLWGNSCCSHPRAGEELLPAAHRRLTEELSCDCPLEEIGSFVYFHRFADDLFEYEYDHVLIGAYAGPVQADPREIEEVKWCAAEEIMAGLLSRPEEYCAWFRTAAPMVFRRLQEKGAL